MLKPRNDVFTRCGLGSHNVHIILCTGQATSCHQRLIQDRFCKKAIDYTIRYQRGGKGVRSWLSLPCPAQEKASTVGFLQGPEYMTHNPLTLVIYTCLGKVSDPFSIALYL